MSAVHVSHVSFSYSSAVPIVEDASFDLGPGWAGLVGANGAGKSTLLGLIAGNLAPDSGRIITEPAGRLPVLCEQRVDDRSNAIEQFALDWQRESVRLRGRLELVPEQLDRWATLSPGERKRWQIGAALADDPPVLLLDEPTNHLDSHARALVEDALESYRGCGILVSHDRSLLNDLTARTIRVASGRVEVWNGPYSVAHDAWTARATQQAERHERMRNEQKKLERRIADQRRKSQEKDAQRKRERRAAGIHDLDTRGSAATYRHERGQKTGPQTVSSMTTSVERLNRDMQAMDFERDLGGAITFDFAPADKEYLLRYDGAVTAGHRTLFDADVAVRRDDRIRVAGPNGIGKTSLVEAMTTGLAIDPSRVLHLRQESSAADARAWLDEARTLDPTTRGRVMSLVALLGSDPGTLLASDAPSPGEARKLAMALGLGTAKWLLILDEPTNHLDLPAIERLEAALVAYPGAVVLITHDDQLAATTTATTWDIDGSDLRV